MKIAIYETVHLDWIIPLCGLFSTQTCKVSFFTSSQLEDDIKEALNIQYQQFQWTYLEPESSWKTHYSRFRLFLHSQDFDLIILNSLDSRHLLIFTALAGYRNKKILINIHDVNNFFKAGYSLTLKKNVRTFGKNLLAFLSSGYIVNAKSMKEYIESSALTKKPVFWLSPVISRAEYPDNLSYSPLVIVIPGSIDERRRDYLFALEVFKIACKNNPGKLELVLAGCPVGSYGQIIINKARELLNKGLKLTYFEHEINEVTFQEIIGKSHLVFSPASIITSIHDGIKEVYGLSKNSGNIYDAIRHGKPLLIPSSLTVPVELKSSCLTYDSKESLLKLFDLLVNSESDIRHYSMEAYKNAQHFSKEKMEERIVDLLNSVIGKK